MSTRRHQHQRSEEEQQQQIETATTTTTTTTSSSSNLGIGSNNGSSSSSNRNVDALLLIPPLSSSSSSQRQQVTQSTSSSQQATTTTTTTTQYGSMQITPQQQQQLQHFLLQPPSYGGGGGGEGGLDNKKKKPIQTSMRLITIPRSQHKRQGRDGTAKTILTKMFHIGGGKKKDSSPSVDDDSDDSENDYDDDDFLLGGAKDRLLERALNFNLKYSPERGYRAIEFTFCSWKRPHMRAMHMSWICFFASYYVQFAMAPLLPQLQTSLNLTKKDIWLTNVWMMIGGFPLRFVLGPLCDTYGPRFVICYVVALCSIACALSGLIVYNLFSLLVIRFIIGAMDAFVPCQCWITSHFVREVGGTIMAIAGGLGASGSAFTQLAGGIIFVFVTNNITNGDEDIAWRIALIFPAIFGLIVAYLAYTYSDDCPLGNFIDVKRAGLMMERSAVDSFRSGVYNINSWLLFLQFAGSCGVDVTMCNGCAIYYHNRFTQNITNSGIIAFLYGLSALWARGVGGYISDLCDKHFSLLGRLWLQFLSMLLQGIFNIWFARTDNLQSSIIIMIIMSILIQISMGACYGIVPYVDSANTGSIAGIVGGGGNVGAALLGVLFMTHDYDDAMEYMGYFTIIMALLTPLIVIKGYKGIIFGKENTESDDRKQRSPLMVPRKMQHSPHLVKIRRKQRAAANTSPQH